MQPSEIKALARRVAARALAERGRELPVDARPGGVHVTLDTNGEPLRANASAATSPKPRGVELISAEALVGLARGATLRIPIGALVTDLARDEAWRRGIRVVEGAGAASDRLRIAIGADHGGFKLKGEIVEWVRALGHEAFDLGTRDENAVDYPDYARAVAEAVAAQNADVGIMIDGAGIGSAMAANKVPGIRAANCWDVTTARNAREHNYANVLTLGGKLLQPAAAREIVRTFLATPWGEERHGRRIEKINAIERHYSPRSTSGARTT